MTPISICIPVYNCDITMLVSSLLSCREYYKAEYEIVVIDDASQQQYKEVNRGIQDLDLVKYTELEKNIGRSAIRNLFLEYIKFENLLFLDCDTIILDPRYFINNYLNHFSEKTGVICGGRVYSSKPNNRKYTLRWKYGMKRESNLANKRAKMPYHSFMTNNFFITKNILENIKFEEKLTGYGHEDSLFGYQLMKNKVFILHIDNPTAHNFDETVDEFLKKTREGIKNLFYIHRQLVPKGEFVKINKLLKAYEQIEKIRTVTLFRLLSYLVLPILERVFWIGIVPLWLFDSYKLLYLCRVAKLR